MGSRYGVGAVRKGAPRKRVANVVLGFGFVFLTVFTVAMTVGFFVTGTEAPMLITCVYGFWGAELGGLLVKRIFDKRKGVAEDEDRLEG